MDVCLNDFDLFGHDCPDACGGGSECPYVGLELAAARKRLRGVRHPDRPAALDLAVVLGRSVGWDAARIVAEAATLAQRASFWRRFQGKGHPEGAVVVPHTGALYLPVATEGPEWCPGWESSRYITPPTPRAAPEPLGEDPLPF